MENQIYNDKQFLFEMRNRYGILYEIDENNKKKLRDIIIVNYELRNFQKNTDFFFIPMKKEIKVYGSSNQYKSMLNIFTNFITHTKINHT
jgi:hypothetical protein